MASTSQPRPDAADCHAASGGAVVGMGAVDSRRDLGSHEVLGDDYITPPPRRLPGCRGFARHMDQERLATCSIQQQHHIIII